MYLFISVYKIQPGTACDIVVWNYINFFNT